MAQIVQRICNGFGKYEWNITITNIDNINETLNIYIGIIRHNKMYSFLPIYE